MKIASSFSLLIRRYFPTLVKTLHAVVDPLFRNYLCFRGNPGYQQLSMVVNGSQKVQLNPQSTYETDSRLWLYVKRSHKVNITRLSSHNGTVSRKMLKRACSFEAWFTLWVMMLITLLLATATSNEVLLRDLRRSYYNNCCQKMKF